MAIALFNQPQGKTYFGCQICCQTLIIVTKNKERFLKKKRKGKTFLYLYNYAITEES